MSCSEELEGVIGSLRLKKCTMALYNVKRFNSIDVEALLLSSGVGCCRVFTVSSVSHSVHG